MQIGDKIKFGNHEWRVLDICDKCALIITESIIEQRPYHVKMAETTWADCGLRKYLNTEFLDSFSEEDRAKIILTTNQNPANPWYGTEDGETTQDMVFLLDVEEAVCKYFGDSSHHLQNRRPTEKYWFHKNDENNAKRIATYQGHGYWWWLRSLGRNGKNAVYIHHDGCVGINGNSVFFRNFGPERDGGVRPALWINLE